MAVVFCPIMEIFSPLLMQHGGTLLLQLSGSTLHLCKVLLTNDGLVGGCSIPFNVFANLNLFNLVLLTRSGGCQVHWRQRLGE